MDCFAGSGTTGDAASRLGRRFLLGDHSPDAMAIMKVRLAPVAPRILDLSGADVSEHEAEDEIGMS